jgi:predicted permease
MRARLFRVLLALLPRAFRSRFGAEILDTAASLDRARPARLIDAPGVAADAVATLLVIRHEMRVEARTFVSPSRRSLMDGVLQDLRFAARGLRRDRTFTAFVVAALTLGIGANAAMFGIADRLLVSGPPHILDARRVVRLYVSVQPENMRVFTTDGFGYVSYDLVRRESRSFDQLATYAINDVTTGTGADAHVIRGGYASDTLFPLLGVQPRLGRFFDASENSPAGAAHVAVLGYGTWQQAFGGASDAIGRNVIIGGEPYVVVGVAPRGFTGPQFGVVDVWLPMNLRGPATTKEWQTSWTAQWLQIVGRLAPGVTNAQAATEVTAILQRGYTGQKAYVAHGQYSVAGLSANDQGVEAPEVTIVRWLSGVALIVLVIACANVANLLLARGVRRSREVALRSALGAGRSRIVRLLLIESLLLAGGGGVGGLVVAYALGGVARRAIFSWVDWASSPVDARVLVASAALAVLTGVLVGLLPALRVTQFSLGDTLKRGAREGGGQRSRLRHTLTVAQAALSVVLLIGAGLFVRSLWNVRTLPLGFDPDRVLLVEASRPGLSRISEPAARAVERARRNAATMDAIEAIRRLPGVERASAAVGTPFGNRFGVTIRVPGLEAIPQLESGGPSVSAVAADYFATVGTRILRGRAFGPEDHAGTEPVAIVSDTMARTIWPNRDALGQCVISGESPSPPCARIVGVAEDTHRDALRESAVMHYYIPFGQEVDFGGTVLVVRAAGDPLPLGPAIRRTMIDLDGTIRYVNLATIQDAIDPQTKPWRIGAAVFVFSGVLALLVAAIGMYSVMSYLVADRTREIGVRLALGARAGDVARLILLSSVGMAAVGIAAGSLIAGAASPFVEPLLFNEHARDPVVFLGVAGVLVFVSLAAGILPMIRANRIDPLEALRVE